MRKRLRNLMSAEADGIGVVEVVLILVVIIGLVVIFRDQIQDIIEALFGKIEDLINSF